MILRYIKMLLEIFIFSKKIKLSSNKKNIFIFLAADYGNVGDIAITCAQEKFLKRNFVDYEIVKVPLKCTYSFYKSIKKQIKKDDIITIIGGGNMGDLYFGFELKRQFIIKNFKNNKIISFPQTIFFTNTNKGKKMAKRCKKIYGNNSNLIISARESMSFSIMKKMFPNNHVILTPDIVLSYSISLNENRNKITLCLRNDIEKCLDKEKENELVKKICKKFGEIQEIDTHIGNIIINNNEEKILNEKLLQFAKSKVVITDRLHGMIFCAITGTPCIVLANNNHKIKMTYHDWLKKFSWIAFYEKVNIDEIIKKINDFYNLGNQKPIVYKEEFLYLINESDD